MDKVLVTGANGFLGRHLVAELQARGIHPSVARSRDVDLCDAKATERWFFNTAPNVVIHAAARCGGIGATKQRPGAFFYDNMQMGINVVEASRMVGVRKLLVIGTVCSYPKFCSAPFHEFSLWDGYPEETNASYGIAKKALLEMMRAYRAEYGLNGITLLQTNLYGPGDHFDPGMAHVIPEMIRKFETARKSGDREVVLWGDGTPTRDFLYAEDAARGICDALYEYDSVEPVNLGSGIETPINFLADLVRNATGYSGEIRWDGSKPNGQPRRVLDVSRARDAFGFETRWALTDGLAETVAWYRAQ